MKSCIKKIINNDLFLSSNVDENKTYKIPIYQRHYDWDSENAINLLNDIAEAIELKKPHYTGSFLLTDTDKPIVIDGQQRMITTLISLKAFYFVCEDNSIKEKIEHILFTNPEHKTSEYLRLIVSKQDSDLFNAIMCVKKFSLIKKHNDSKMFQNFKYAYDFFSALKETYTDDEIFNLGFGNLQICELIIEDNIDDEAQKIFRDLNSKGQALKSSDLIRNYLLMSQEELYDQYWIPIESMFNINGEFSSDLFEEFIFNYVLMKYPVQINENKIFNAYMNLCEKEDGEFIVNGKFDREKAVEDLLEYATLYRLFLNINIDEEEVSTKYENTIKLLAELRDMKQTTPYPFLMRVLMDENNGIIDVKTLNDVINLIIVYYIRAIVCKVSTSSRRGYLLTMYKNIFGDVEENKNKENYYKSIYKYIHENGSGSKMPTEKKFLDELKTFNLYGNRPVCRQVLKVIVNNRYPNEFGEKIEVVNPTIEHLLPETPNSVWEQELGGKEKLDKAMEYVHTIGNLSLANHNKNSELSNKSRKEKAEILEKYGEALNVLNRKFIDLDENFSLQFIKDRSDELIKIVKDRYHLDSVSTKGIYFENYDIIDGNDGWDERFKGREVAYLELDGVSYKTNNFYDVNIVMQTFLAKENPQKYESIVENSPTMSNHPILSRTQNKGYYLVPGTNGIYFKYETGGTNFFSACRVATAVGYPLSKIKLLVKKQKYDPKSLKATRIDDLGELVNNEVFVIRRKAVGIYAEAIYTEGHMVILKGSKIQKEAREYMNDSFIVLRNNLLDSGIVNEDYEFVTNCMFTSPSAASCVVLGYNSNGKTSWYKKANEKINLQSFLED